MYRGTGEKQRALAVLASLFLSSSCVARPFSSFLYSSLKAPGRFSEATGAGGIRVELDYTAKGYIYRARMYAEARTSAQRGRPCGFSLDATSRVDSRIRCWPRFSHPARLSLSFSFSFSLSLSLSLSLPPSSPRNGLPNFPLLTVYVSSSEPEDPSLALVLTCVPSVHDYESFLLIRFIEPLHQTGATLCLPLFLSSPLFRVDSMYMYGTYTRCKNASREYATPNGFE